MNSLVTLQAKSYPVAKFEYAPGIKRLSDYVMCLEAVCRFTTDASVVVPDLDKFTP